MKQWPYGTAQTVALLAPFACAFAFALDIYIPSVPKLPAYFNTSPFMVQLTLSCFLIINGLGQLIAGPLCDQLGRKSLGTMSILLFIIGSLLCAISPCISSLIGARILQAFGTCGCIVMAFAVVRDTYSGVESARIYSYLNGSIAISPMLAPVIGSYLDHAYHWRMSFVFLALIGFVALYIIRKQLPETLPTTKRTALNKTLVTHYTQIFNHRHFLLYAIIAACGTACFFTYFSFSSYIYIHLLHTSERLYAYYFAFTAGISILGSACGGYWCGKLGTTKTAAIGCSITLLGGLTMLASYLTWGLTIMTFLLPMFLVVIGCTILLGAATGGALQPFQHVAGTAAAALGVFQYSIAAITGTLLLTQEPSSHLALVGLFIITGTIGLCCSALLQKQDIKHEN